jgi:hypothetical protein
VTISRGRPAAGPAPERTNAAIAGTMAACEPAEPAGHRGRGAGSFSQSRPNIMSAAGSMPSRRGAAALARKAAA